MTHVELATGGPFLRAMSHTIYNHTASAANTLATIAVKLNREFAFLDQLLVQYVEQFKERHVRICVRDVVRLETTWRIWSGLTPDFQLDVHVV